MLRDAWRLAAGTLVAWWPAAPPRAVDRRRAGAAMLLAPAAVLPLGVLAGVVVWLGCAAGLPPTLLGLLAVGALALGTRALHLDGLADLADGLTASYDRERSLAVMRSGTAGPAGVVALIVVLGVQTGGIAGLAGTGSGWRSGLLTAVAVAASRGALVLCCRSGVPGARSDGLGRTFVGTVPTDAAVALWLVLTAALTAAAVEAGLAWWHGPLAAGLAVGVVLVVVARARRRLGGVTGDVFGAGVELALAAVLLGLLAAGA